MHYHTELLQDLKGMISRRKRNAARKGKTAPARRVVQMPAMQTFAGLQGLENRLLMAANAFGHDFADHTSNTIDLTSGSGGVTVVLDDADDATASIDLGNNTFTFYGTQYTGANKLFVSDNGLITFNSGEASPGNGNLAASPTQASIAVMWDDWTTAGGANDMVLAKFEDVNGDGVSDRLLIEWSDVTHSTAGGGSVTFQAVLRLNTGATEGDIILNYLDSTTGNGVANGASATVGVKNANSAEDGADPQLVSQNTGNATLFGDNQSVRISNTVLDTTAPTVSITAISPDPRNSAVSSVTFTFDEAVVGFELSDLSLTRDGGENLLTGSETLETNDGGTTWTLSNISGLTGEDGEYALTVSASSGVIDNQLNTLETGDSDSWTVDTVVPTVEITAVSPDPTGAAVDSITIVFSKAVTGFTAADLALTLNGGPNLLDGNESLNSGDNITWTLSNLSGFMGADGEYTLTLTAAASGIEDAAGNALAADASDSFTLDTTAPSAPASLNLASESDTGLADDDDETSSTTPTITGTAEVGSVVKVFIDGDLNGQTTADGDGNWTYSFESGLSVGANSITATATDSVNNTSVASAALVITIDTAAPDAPGAIDLDSGSDSGSSSSDNITSNQNPTITGTAEANAFVQVFDGETEVGSTFADGNGDFSLVTTQLSNGVHVLTAKATDLAGNVSAASASLEITVDNSAPGTPSTPDLTAGTDSGVSSTDNLTNDRTPTFDGTAAAGSTIEVFVNGVSNGTTTADGSGNWSYTIQGDLSDGGYDITATATDTAGNTSAATSALAITVDATAPTADVVNVSPDPRNKAVNSLGVTFSEAVSGFDLSDFTITLDGGDNRVTGSQSLSGSGSSFTVGSTNAITTGQGTFTATIVASGSGITDLAGNALAGDASDAWDADTVGPTIEITAVSPDPRNTTVNSITITASEEIVNFSIADLSLTLNGGANLLTGGQSLSTGDNITFTLTNLSGITGDDGTYVLSLVANGSGIEDTSGNLFETDATETFVVDTTAPAAPTADLNANENTNDTTPTITGTAEAFASVEVFVDGVSNGTTTADENGDWSYDIVGALAEGSYDITAKATDEAGNESVASSTLAITVDTTNPATPAAADLASGSDSGVNSDDNTSDSTPTFTGTAEANSTVTIFANGEEVGSGTADGNGDYSITVSVLPDGNYNITATATDAAGNVSSASAPLAIVVDTTAPDAPLALDHDADDITSDTTPTITGTAQANSTVEVFVNGVSNGTTTADGDGNWSYDISGALSDGGYDITAKSTDTAGNVSAASTALSITVDTTAPSVPSTPDLASASDSGASSTDNLTNDTTATVTGTAEAGATIEVFIDGVSDGTTTADGNGDWTYTITGPLPTGASDITATATDAAGNASAATAALTVTIDSSSPATPSTPDLLAASDTGVDTDDNTSDSTPTLTGTAEADAIVTIFVDGVQAGTTTADGSGDWSFTFGSPLSDGTYAITAGATDAAGNNSSVTVGLSVTIDTAAPSAPAALDLDADDLTNDTTPTITGTAQANSSVEIFVDGVSDGTTTADGSGNWSHTLAALAEGTFAITAKATDTAGNESAASTALNITVDTTAPATPSTPNLLAASDTGSSTSDDLTNNTTPVVNGTSPANAIVKVYVGGVLDGQTTANGSGNWSYTITGPLATGANLITATSSDAAGNESAASAALTVTIDNTAPSAPGTPDVFSTSDTGSSSTDDNTSDTTPTIIGTAEANSIVIIFAGGSQVGAGVADGSGDYAITIAPLANGVHNITATAKDAAGNESAASVALEVTIDNTAPSAPTALDGDDNTNDTTPTITGTAEANSTVTVFVGGVQNGTTTADGDGNWSYNLTNQAPGTYTVTAKATDAAGNLSSASVGFNVTIDTTAPSAPSTPAGDSTTNATHPEFTGTAEAGSTVSVFVDGDLDGTTLADENGDWSYTLEGALAEGTFDITATATDEAGNTSAASAAFEVTVDLTAPATPSTPDLASASDSGTNSDNITNDTTPTFTGTSEANVTVNLYAGEFLAGTTTADGNGDWSITTGALDPGTYSFTATTVDSVGNESAASAALEVTVATTGPSAPTALDLDADDVTNDNTPTITGTAQAGSTVEVFVAGVSNGTTTADGEGNWSYTIASALSDGGYDITATATDGVGNTSAASSALAITIDTVAPVAPSELDLASSDDTGSSSSDNLTSDTLPEISGTAEAGALISVFVGGELDGTTTANEVGAWSYVIDSALSTGANAITATATDAAGNESSVSATLTVTIDTTAPNTPSVPDLASASDSNVTDDNITSDNTPTFTGTAEANALVRIFANGVQVGSANADGSGNYSVTTSTLDDGAYSFTARVTDAAGNNSGFSEALAVTIDTASPVAPNGLSYGTDGPINDSTPTVTGFAEAGATVEVFVGGVSVGTTTADGEGNWSFTFGNAFSDGSYDVTASAADAAGNESDASGTLVVTIDTIAPEAPSVNGDEVTGDDTPTITGTAEVGSTVELFLGETSLGTVDVDGEGNWSFTFDSLLADGEYAITARATDAAGNVSEFAATLNFTVDTEATTVTITPVEPDPRNEAVESITIVFSEAVTNIDLSFLTLTRNGGENLLTEEQSLTTEDNITWTLSGLGSLTGTGGIYTLTLTNENIGDEAGNPLAEGATEEWTFNTVAPTLTTVSTLTGGIKNTEFVITYDDLAEAANENDEDGGDISFRIVAVTTGTLTKDGEEVVAGETFLSPGEELVWTPASNAVGTLNAFTIRANDGFDDSSSAVQVKVAVANPTVAIAAVDEEASEAGDEGVFEVTRNGNTDAALTVFYTITGTAKNGTDYTTLTGSVVIEAGEESAFITITPNDDVVFDLYETVIVTLKTNSGYVIDGELSSATATISDNEPIVTITATDDTATEAGLTTAEFTVTLSNAVEQDVKVFFTVTDTATVNSDYVKLPGFIIIPAGETSATITVTPKDDTRAESDETVTVTLKANAAYGIGEEENSATVTIEDDEPTVSVEATDDEADETGSGTATFTFTLSNAVETDTSVFFTVTGTAKNGTDYTKIAKSVVILAGETTATVTITPTDDTLAESADVNETVTLTLRSRTTYRIDEESAAATAQIADNESTVSIAATEAADEEGLVPGAFTVTRDGGDNSQVLRVFFTVKGTAKAGTDYAAITKFVDIPAGDDSVVIDVNTLQDTLAESNETVIITLSANKTYRLDTDAKVATVAIADNEPVVSVVASDSEAGETGLATGAFTITRTGDTTNALTVFFAVAGTAKSGTDFNSLFSSVVIPAGEESVVVTVTPKADSLTENDETVILTLKPAGTYHVDGDLASAIVTIADLTLA